MKKQLLNLLLIGGVILSIVSNGCKKDEVGLVSCQL